MCIRGKEEGEEVGFMVVGARQGFSFDLPFWTFADGCINQQPMGFDKAWNKSNYGNEKGK